MNIRSQHINKSIEERRDYQRYIEKQHYEPTVDETIEFAHTVETGEELSQPTTKRKRKISAKQRLGNHLSENWPLWLIGLIIIILAYYTTDSKIDFAEIVANLKNIEKTIDKIEIKVEENNKAISDQSIDINENKIRIEYLQTGK